MEFDPRLPAAKVSPRLIVVSAGVLALAVGWKLTEPIRTPAGPTLDAAAFTALQHQAFQQTEAQPGLSRPENVPVKIQPGETFAAAVQRAGVTAAEAQAAVSLLGQAMDTVNIKAGLGFEAAIARPAADSDGPAKLLGLSLRTGPATAITLSRTFDGALRLRELAEPVRDETTVAQGKMQGSLYQSAASAGASPTITAEVVKLFSHKLDFSRDIKPGDQFRMVFDRKVTESGKTVETGELLYAEIGAKGQTTRFYRFDSKSGPAEFFDETGKNIRGFLLRFPIDGARITSRFGARRHPILGYTRMHQGIDFGAGSGTPILSAGAGVVSFSGRAGGYGNQVRVRHQGGWETSYSHMSRFAKGLKKGQRVAQGQLIGYVGTTGLSTGPHLHYEIALNGRKQNPIGAKIPQGNILSGAELAAFKAQKARIDAILADASKASPQQMASLALRPAVR